MSHTLALLNETLESIGWTMAQLDVDSSWNEALEGPQMLIEYTEGRAEVFCRMCEPTPGGPIDACKTVQLAQMDALYHILSNHPEELRPR